MFTYEVAKMLQEKHVASNQAWLRSFFHAGLRYPSNNHVSMPADEPDSVGTDRRCLLQDDTEDGVATLVPDYLIMFIMTYRSPSYYKYLRFPRDR